MNAASRRRQARRVTSRARECRSLGPCPQPLRQQSEEHPASRPHGAQRRSRDLGFAPRPRPMIDFHLENPERMANRPNLHLKCPTPGSVVHVELEELLEVNRPEGWQILKAMAEKQTHELRDESIPHASVCEGCADTSLAAATDAEREIGLSTLDRADQLGDLPGPFGVIGVQEHENVRSHRPREKMLDSGQAGGAVATLGCAQDLGSTGHRDFVCAILGTVVHHEDRSHRLLTKVREETRKGGLFIERRDQDGHRVGHRVGHGVGHGARVVGGERLGSYGQANA